MNAITSLALLTRIALPALLGAFIALFADDARGQIQNMVAVQPPKQVFPWGSTNSLVPFAVTNTRNISIGVYQGDVDGADADFPGDVSFTSMADINSAFQEVLAFAANLSIENPAINKSAPLMVAGYALNNDYPQNVGCFTFVVPDEMSINVANVNGSWVLPSLSAMTLMLPQQMPFQIPGLQWARLEVYHSTNLATPFLVVDSRNPASSSPTNGIDISNQAITIATAFLASGNTGPYRLKVSTLAANGFQIVDGTGMRVLERPLAPVISRSAGTVKVTVTGGDPGRVFAIQKSADLKTWTQDGSAYTVGTNTWSATLQETVSPASGIFYRTATLDVAP